MWKLKVLIQFFLSKLPFGEELNHLLQKSINRFSPEETSARILELSKNLYKINRLMDLEGVCVVEIGTGWDLINPILLYLMGAKICHTYDHVRHVRFELVRVVISAIEINLLEISKVTHIPVDLLRSRFVKLQECESLDDLLLQANIIYRAPADASLSGLENSSVDLIYSHAVLEHVPEKTIYDLMEESKRILKDKGVAYHLIGLHDHYARFSRQISRVNFLQYPEWLWSFFIKNKISYHNRLREKQFLHIFESCGGQVVWLEHKIDISDVDALQYMKIDKSFHGI